MILVTGAAGKTGQAVIKALARDGAATRGFIRNSEQTEIAISAGASEVVVGDLTNSADLERALAGVDALYLICPNVHPNEFEIGQLWIDAARKAGLKRFVYHSVLYPQIEAMPHHWQKLRVEEALIGSGIDFSILQPASYIQNLLPYWDAMRTDGEYRVPYNIESLFSPADLDDVAEAASRVLLEDEHSAASYQLAGPQILSSAAMASAAAKQLGRTVSAVQQPLSEWRQQAVEGGMQGYALDTLSKMFEYYNQHGFHSSDKTLEMLLGRKAKTLAQVMQNW
jgi:NAD(P)H dehydrogenase (quinone)